MLCNIADIIILNEYQMKNILTKLCQIFQRSYLIFNVIKIIV